MTFPSSAGYGNLPNSAWSPVIYSKKTLLSLKKKSVVDDITNTEFQGEINQAGDTVKIIKQPIISVGDYTRGQQLSSQDIVDEDITMLIDQAKYYQFYFDDIEQKQSHVDYMDMCVDAASYALRDTYDSNILTYMASNVASANTVGSSGSPKTVGFGGGNDYLPLDIVSRLARLLDEANVPWDNRFLVASPAFYEALRREDSKLIEVQVTGDPQSLVRNPKLATTAMIHGFKMYMSNNAPTDTYPVLLAGHTMATATAASILKSETIRSQNSFGDINRGLLVFGRKVLRTECLAKAVISIGDV